MQFFGYYKQEHRGEICHRTMEAGKIPIVGFVAGVIGGVWEGLLESLITETDYEWLMIDARHYKVHPRTAGATADNQTMSRTKRDSIPRYTWPWMRMVCRSELLLQKVPELIARKPVH